MQTIVYFFNVWMNDTNLIAMALQISKGNHPQMAIFCRGESYPVSEILQIFHIIGHTCAVLWAGLSKSFE